MKREPPPTGEPSAYEVVAALYAQAYPMVWGILGRAGICQAEDRSDLAHDAFIVALQAYPTRDPAAPRLAWLAAITWNVARNYRALARIKREALVEHPEPASSAASPEDVVASRRYYLDLVDGLDHERLVVFDMHEIEGFEIPEIARARGIPEGTAATRLRLAREHVQAAAARLEAAAARAERRPMVLPALLPFGAGAWSALGKPFEAAPPGMEQQVWRAIGRTIAAGGALGRAAGVAVAGKAAAALVAAGAVAGGGAVLLALKLLSSAAPAPAPSISRAPDLVAVASVLPSASAASSVAEPDAVPPSRPGSASSAAPARATTATPPTAIDPDEERLIQQAQAAFAHKNYDAARDALREHAARFPRGQLASDRRSLLSQMPREAASASPSTSSAPSALDAGRAPHRQFGTDE